MSATMKLQDNTTNQESKEAPMHDNIIQPLKDQVSEVEKIVKAGEYCLNSLKMKSARSFSRGSS